MDILYAKEAVLLKEAKQVMNKLISEDPMESLCMVDFIQRLGIDHHFQEHIDAALEKQHFIVSRDPIHFVQTHQLYKVALTFRLLRQGGYSVNSDIFESLINNKVKFREAYGEDVKDLIAIHEAAQLSIGEEDTTLDDAGLLSRELLHSWLSSRHQGHHHNHDEAQYVASSLQQPLHHNLCRFMDKTILLRNFKADDKESMCFMELAEINSCIVKLMNQHEGLQVSKWWSGEAMSKEAKLGGYEALKWYMWSMTCFTDPSFSEQRIELTKCIALVYVIDDIFDVYGTLDQLTLFTDAVKRWELVGTEELPEFMKICLRALYEITNDFADKVYKKHGLNPIDTVKNSWIRLTNAFLEETRWLSCGELPKSEEYLKHAIVSTGVHVALVHAFFLFDQNITNETLGILDDFPTIIYSVAKILRLSDDLEGHKNNKNQRGFDGSYIECYVREHEQVSAEDAERHVEELISMEWKNLNRQVLGKDQQQFPSSFTKFCLNAARMVPLMYHYRTNPSFSNLHQYIKSIAKHTI